MGRDWKIPFSNTQRGHDLIFLSQIFIWQTKLLPDNAATERRNQGPPLKSISSRKGGVKSLPPLLLLSWQDGGGLWTKDHRATRPLQDVPSSEVTEGWWELDPGAGNLIPMVCWAVESQAGRKGPGGQGSKGLRSWAPAPWGRAGAPGSG